MKTRVAILLVPVLVASCGKTASFSEQSKERSRTIPVEASSQGPTESDLDTALPSDVTSEQTDDIVNEVLEATPDTDSDGLSQPLSPGVPGVPGLTNDTLFDNQETVVVELSEEEFDEFTGDFSFDVPNPVTSPVTGPVVSPILPPPTTPIQGDPGSTTVVVDGQQVVIVEEQEVVVEQETVVEEQQTVVVTATPGAPPVQVPVQIPVQVPAPAPVQVPLPPSTPVVPPAPILPAPSIVAQDCGNADISLDWQLGSPVLSVRYSDYLVEVEAGPSGKGFDSSAATSVLANCSVQIFFPAVSGFRFGLVEVIQRGAIELTPGASGRLSTQYTVDQASRSYQAQFRRTWGGPVSQNFTSVDPIAQDESLFAACGQAQTVTLSSQIELVTSAESGLAEGFLQLDQTDLNLATDGAASQLGSDLSFQVLACSDA